MTYVSVPTAARLAGVTAPTIRAWAKRYGIGKVEGSTDGKRKHREYRIDLYATHLLVSGQDDELAAYLAGCGNLRRRADFLSIVGLGLGPDDCEGADMTERKRPLLIEHSLVHVAASTRRKLLTEAERRGVSPLAVLVEAYEQREASNDHDV